MGTYTVRKVQRELTIHNREYERVHSAILRALELNELRVKKENPGTGEITCKLPPTMKNWGQELFVIMGALDADVKVRMEMTSSSHSANFMITLIEAVFHYTVAILNNKEPKVNFSTKRWINSIIGIGEIAIMALFITFALLSFQKHGSDRIGEIIIYSFFATLTLGLGMARFRWAKYLSRLQNEQVV